MTWWRMQQGYSANEPPGKPCPPRGGTGAVRPDVEAAINLLVRSVPEMIAVLQRVYGEEYGFIAELEAVRTLQARGSL